MEMFIAGIENSDKFCGNREELKDVAEWKGVKIDTEHVIELSFEKLHRPALVSGDCRQNFLD